MPLCLPVQHSTPGTRISVQVHRPVPYPVLKSNLWEGGRAVQSEHPGALSVDPLRSKSGQPQLRESGVHTGQSRRESNNDKLNLCFVALGFFVTLYRCSTFTVSLSFA